MWFLFVPWWESQVWYRCFVRRGCVLCNPHMYDDGLSEHHGHVTKTMSPECMTKKNVWDLLKWIIKGSSLSQSSWAPHRSLNTWIQQNLICFVSCVAHGTPNSKVGEGIKITRSTHMNWNTKFRSSWRNKDS
jgi:hypothetical protein